MARPRGRAAPARRRRSAALAHNAVLFRQPITTLDDVLARGLRIEALGELVEASRPRVARDADDDAVLDAATSPSARRSCARRRSATSTPSSSTSRRCGAAAAARSRRPGTGCRSSTSRTPPRSAGPGEPVWAPRGSSELDFELEVGAIVDTPAFNLSEERAAEAIGGYFVLNDWSARDLQRDETAVRLGPAKGKDFATSIGPWIVTPDELADRRAPGANGAGPRR